jgi:hypothetical protein
LPALSKLTTTPPIPEHHRSFLAGFKNNLLGMVGFVREGRKSKGAFDERMQREQKIRELAAAKRAERDASSG